MVLTLEITGPEAAKLGANQRKVFRNTGGTIGRAPENEWVLPDQYVSSRHARVRYADGVFFLDDTSRNGIWLNEKENRLKAGQPYPIQDGDVIGIDPFEIRATIALEAEDSSFSDDPFLTPKAPLPVQPARSGAFEEDDPFVSDDPFNDPFRPGPPEQKKSAGPSAGQLAGGSGIDAYYKPPDVVPAKPPVGAAPNFIPDDWDKSQLNIPVRSPASAPSSAPSPVRRPTPGSRGPDSRVTPASRSVDVVGLAEVLKGAGLSGVNVTPELAQNFGEIIRVVVTGVMELLRARQQIKDEFRLKATRFTAKDNNPLKFSADVEDALHNLLVKRGAAYLGPVESFEDAFDDLRNHQMAVLEGMRVAFESMLAQFSPDRLQEEFDRALKNSMVPAKLRYWELYRDKVRDMVSDADESFRELFGNEFAKAYEQQLARLKAEARAGKV